jgi:cob(I)alamin adenosyltransferase
LPAQTDGRNTRAAGAERGHRRQLKRKQSGAAMKIYPKTGDQGQTGSFGGPRLWKDDPRIEAFGTVDELNAVLGWARSEPGTGQLDGLLARIQHQLFALGAELATPDPDKHGTRLLGQSQIEELEQAIDELQAGLPPLRQFILPGGSPAAGALHVARAVCRRAERRVVALRREPGTAVAELAVTYLNRLGDLLFVAARAANLQSGGADVPWEKPG